MAKKTKKIPAPKGAELKLEPKFALRRRRQEIEFRNHMLGKSPTGIGNRYNLNPETLEPTTKEEYMMEYRIQNAFNAARRGKEALKKKKKK
jgi:hypothetical protein